MKKFTARMLVMVLLVLTCACFTACGDKKDDAFKVGVILIGDETEGYTKAHMDGIKEAAKKLGVEEANIIWKYKVEETAACADAAEDLVDAGCKVVISNSYGHQNFMAEVAKKYSNVQFISMTGDFAAISGISNFSNAFTNIYESRYVSGVIAGMKVKEMIDNGEIADANKDANGNIKIGYVGAFPYAEVVSGYTAFYLGVKSIVSNVVMDVQYTSSWFDYEKEKTTATALIERGCVVIGQHADSTGAPTACEDARKNGKNVYSVGYNVDMLAAAPEAALTSATNNWSVYYEYAFSTAMKGDKIAQNWAKGYAEGAVDVTKLGPKCAAGTQAKVDEVVAGIKAGTLHVFDTNSFTVNGSKITTNKVDLSFLDFSTNPPTVVYKGDTVETVKDGYVEESVVRSAPYFSLRIDGITELNN